jgi:ligand-binding SRPBCC domain-containing protein
MPVFEKRTFMRASAREVFAFHELPDAFQRLTPPWLNFHLKTKTPGLDVGVRLEGEVHLGPFRQRIVSEHVAYEKDRLFIDEMRQGPFSRFRHEHRVESDTGGAWLVDHVEYGLKAGRLGELLGGWLARRELKRMFEYRHRVTREYCEARSASD